MVNQEDILKPLIFLDIFDYPPTAMDVWRFLGVQAELEEVIDFLHQRCHHCEGGSPDCEHFIKFLDSRLHKNNIAERLIEKNGFYFLNGRADLAEKRREFFCLTERKFKIAQKAARVLRFIPEVKMAAICNNFYYHPESDIDFFIIIQKGRMWFTRALVTMALHLFRLRRHGKKIADRICLSFYITDDNLNLKSITLKKNSDKNNVHSSLIKIDSSLGVGNDKNMDDPYFCYWLAFLEPVYDNGVYEKFWQANSWIKDFFPNIFPTITNKTKIIKDNYLSVFWKKINAWWFNGFVGDFLENFVKKIQLKKMSTLRRSSLKGDCDEAGCGVIIADNILKFHENDKREYFREQLRIKKTELEIE